MPLLARLFPLHQPIAPTLCITDTCTIFVVVVELVQFYEETCRADIVAVGIGWLLFFVVFLPYFFLLCAVHRRHK